ncbi:MAG: hypothetical protein M0Z84_10900 [Gammaproteobacteria bacterium]|nr:hypothetical protein [Gammaproteobacteria bacterium]
MGGTPHPEPSGTSTLNPMALRHLLPVLTLCCIGFLVPSPARATEWYTQPSLKFSTQSDNNLLLTPVNHSTTTEATVAPTIDFGAAQSNWNIDGNATWRGHRYWGQSGLNGNDQVYNLSSLYRTARTTWQLTAGYAKEKVTANTQFVPDIGLVSAVTPRITRTANPSLTWQLSQRTQLLLNYQTSVVTYNAAGTSLVNYSTRDGSAALQYQWSHRDQLTATLGESYFNVPQLSQSEIGQPAYSEIVNNQPVLVPNPEVHSNTSTTDSAQLGWSHMFSQSLSGNIAVGATRTDAAIGIQTCTGTTPALYYFVNNQIIGIATCTQTADNVFSETSSGYLYSAGLQKQFQLTQLTLSLSRQITPSGIGAEVRMDAATLGISRTFSARLTGSANLASYRIRSISSQSPPLTDRNLIQGSLDLIWQWTRQLAVEGEYRYVTQKFLSNNVGAQDNMVYLSLDYMWRRHFISR